MIMIVDGNRSVNAIPSLLSLVASAAGTVAVPTQTRAAPQDNQHTSSITLRSGAPATPADSAGDPDIFIVQGHRRRRGPVDQP
jgi:hypothetical protein